MAQFARRNAFRGVNRGTAKVTVTKSAAVYDSETQEQAKPKKLKSGLSFGLDSLESVEEIESIEYKFKFKFRYLYSDDKDTGARRDQRFVASGLKIPVLKDSKNPKAGVEMRSFTLRVEPGFPEGFVVPANNRDVGFLTLRVKDAPDMFVERPMRPDEPEVTGFVREFALTPDFVSFEVTDRADGTKVEATEADAE